MCGLFQSNRSVYGVARGVILLVSDWGRQGKGQRRQETAVPTLDRCDGNFAISELCWSLSTRF